MVRYFRPQCSLVQLPPSGSAIFSNRFPWPFIVVFRGLSYALLARLVGTGSSRLSGLLYTATSRPAAIQEERGCGLESPV